MKYKKEQKAKGGRDKSPSPPCSSPATSMPPMSPSGEMNTLSPATQCHANACHGTGLPPTSHGQPVSRPQHHQDAHHYLPASSCGGPTQHHGSGMVTSMTGPHGPMPHYMGL
ncbi:putative Homeobox protein Hox-A3-like [Homarus americanus]|uniref:Putative Homeobox protein Hox-A3-like n=2 Tax=Homarus americanus TaxID=6706 RepID=A0A8J5JXX1_HOMAM|nr:putative Homeobox protein Hox-A3-like [Homarus americanus]